MSTSPESLPRTNTEERAPLAVMSERDSRRVILATFVGTTVEWYDFYLYAASAALIFAPQFFPNGNAVAGQIGAFATFAFGFVSRPLGGMLAGHFGDRLGRKGMLVLSLIVMGVGTTLIGVLPGYAQIGLAAPVLLTILRLLQGLGVGAEWGGAVTMAVEAAPESKKALYGAAPIVGLPAGLLLSNLMLIILGALTGPNFAIWGWRIAFLFSFVLVLLGIWTRSRMPESPVFRKEVESRPARVPFLAVLRRYPIPLLCAIVISGVPAIPAYLVLTWALAYGTTEVGYDRNALLWIGILCCVVQMIALPVLAKRADRGSPRKLAIVSGALMTVAVLVFFPLFESRNILLAGIATLVVHASTYLAWAVIPPILARAFPGTVRYTGVSMAYQIGAIVGGGFAPVIATSILAGTGQTFPVALYVAGASVVMILSVVGLGAYYRVRGNEPSWDYDNPAHRLGDGPLNERTEDDDCH